MAWREVVPSSSKLQVSLSADGLLGHHGDAVQLVRSDRVLIQLLLDRRPDPIREHELKHILWPKLIPSAYAYRTRLVRIRRQLGSVGLALRFRDRVGYTLEESAGFAPPR
jgi:hypothetical protein